MEDKATEYWDYEIKRAAENTAKAFAEYQQAKEEEFEAIKRKLDAEENNADAETKEEAREIYRRKSLIRSQKWDAYLMASKWECITREAAESYKKRKAEKEDNKQEPEAMKQEKSPFVIAFFISFAIVFVVGVLLPFVLMLVSYFREQPTNTTMHQPEPMEQYADSLVCPD